MNTSWNWWLIIGGAVLMVGEVLLGAATGFDLLLLGMALAAGGAIGLLFGSAKVGLFSAGALAFLYLAFLRRRIRRRLTSPDRATNTDVLPGKTGLVVERIAPHQAGMVKVGDELWRAHLVQESGEPREPGAQVVVDSVEGVTLKVR